MWFWLALLSAILGAIEVILSKRILHKVSSSVLAWTTFTLSIPFLFVLSLKDGIPSLNLIFYIGVFGSSLAFVFAKTIGNRSLKQNLISKIMPLAAFSGFFKAFQDSICDKDLSIFLDCCNVRESDCGFG